MDKISTNNLTVGETFKNYKELCAALSVDEKGGNSKKTQLKDFERYFSYEKNGHSFTITEIYDTPKAKVDNRKHGNNSVYVNCIEVLLMHILSQYSGNSFAMTKTNLWKQLGMVNQRFGNKDLEKLQEKNCEIDRFEINNFYFRANRNLDKILTSALNSMKNRRLLEWHSEFVIVTDEANYESHIASELETEIILSTERHILTVMGFSKMTQVFLQNKAEEFYRLVNEKLKAEMEWDFCYRQLRIIFNQAQIIQGIPQVEAELQRRILNDKTVKRMNTDAQNTYNKWKTEYYNQLKNTGGFCDVCKPPAVYLTAQEVLTKELIALE